MFAYAIFVGRLCLFSLFNLLLAGVSFALVRRLGRKWPRSERLSAMIVIFIAQIVLYQVLLGVLGSLNYIGLLIVGTLCTVSLLFLLRNEFVLPGGFRNYWEEALRLWQKVRYFPYPLLLLAVIGIALEFSMGLRYPPLNGDDLGYHLPIAVSWLQTHSLWTTHPPFWFYPGTSELIDLWFLMPFRDDFFVGLQNLPFLLLSLLSLYSIARHERLNVRWSVCGALLFVGVLMLHHQFNTQNNDIVLCALFLVALNFVIQYSISNTWGAWVLASVAGGLMLGTKYYGAYYLILLGCVYLFLVTGYKRWSGIVLDVAIMGGIVFLFGGFWYVRNWIIAGNPLTPMEIRFGAITLFPGYDAYRWQLTTTLMAHRYEAVVWQLLWEALLKSGWLAPLTLPCCIASSIFCIWKAIKKDLPRLELLLNVLLPIALISVLIITPFVVENQPGTLNMLKLAYNPIRFGFPLWAIAGVTLVWLLSGLKFVTDSFGIKFFVTVVVLFPFVWGIQNFFPWMSRLFDFRLETLEILIVCVVLALLLAFERIIDGAPTMGDRAFLWLNKNWRILCGAFALSVGMGALVISLFFYRYRINNDMLFYARDFFPEYPAAQQALRQSKGRVALIGWYVPYFWYGDEFRNQVFICPQHSAQALEACIRQQNVDTLIIASEAQSTLDQFTFLTETDVDWLSQFYQDESIRMYQVLSR